MNGFSPVWIFAWLVNVLDCRNFLSHIYRRQRNTNCTKLGKLLPKIKNSCVFLTAHLYGFSPVCILKWLVSVDSCLNDFSHTAHAKGFSPLTVIVIVRFSALDISNTSSGSRLKTIIWDYRRKKTKKKRLSVLSSLLLLLNPATSNRKAQNNLKFCSELDRTKIIKLVGF